MRKLLTTIVTILLLDIVTLSALFAAPLPVPVNFNVEEPDNNIENDFNFKSLEVNVKDAGYYYAEFWVLPAKYPDGSYTVFKVYVNDKYIGDLTPNQQNWQAIRINGQETIRLNEGSNIITIAVPAPEMPNVETVKIARTDSEAKISSHDYDAFYTKATSGFTYDIPKDEIMNTYLNPIQESNSPTSEHSESHTKHFFDVPLKYTFQTTFSFGEGKEVWIRSYGLCEHDVDIVYIGTRLPSQYTNTGDDTNWYEQSCLIENNPSNHLNVNNQTESSNIPYQKFKNGQINYTLGSSKEMQGLNWKSLSINSPVSIYPYSTFKKIKIPKSGVYLIRLRHRDSGKTGTATLVVNESFIYERQPISFTWLPIEMPADGTKFGTMTFSTNQDQDDPILFIHGADADRVVGYGDDASEGMQIVYGLSKYDSHTNQQYSVKTSGISVSNYSARTPESTCEIIAGVDLDVLNPPPYIELKPRKDYSSSSPESANILSNVIINDELAQNGIISIISQDNIINASINDLCGNIMHMFKGSGERMTLRKEDLHITTPGVYVLRVKTGSEFVSRKVLIN